MVRLFKICAVLSSSRSLPITASISPLRAFSVRFTPKCSRFLSFLSLRSFFLDFVSFEVSFSEFLSLPLFLPNILFINSSGFFCILRLIDSSSPSGSSSKSPLISAFISSIISAISRFKPSISSALIPIPFIISLTGPRLSSFAQDRQYPSFLVVPSVSILVT